MCDSHSQAFADMLAALEAMTEHYVYGVNSGDCGNWNPEEEDVVIRARAAIEKARKEMGE